MFGKRIGNILSRCGINVLLFQQGASSIPERLMDVEIPVVYYAQCFLVYASVLTRNEFCAGNFFLGGQGTCQVYMSSLRISLIRRIFIIM